MNKIGSLEELMIKQVCRYFAYKREMDPIQCSENPSNIYSLEFLSRVYDCPQDNLDTILKTMCLPNNCGKNKDDPSENVSEAKRILLEKKFMADFFRKVNEMKSLPAKQWSDLQHYLCFVYRYCMSSAPDPEQEILSPRFVTNMRSLVVSLMEEDQIQLCLRMFSIVREYTVYAHKEHQKISTVEASIESLFYYYEAFLSATKNICKIFPELEKLLLNTYKLGWLDFNTSVFMYYFYETKYVQNTVRELELLKDRVSIRAAGIYTVLTELHKLWKSQMMGIGGLINSKYGQKFKNLDNKMMIAHRKVLSQNFWIDRTPEEKSIQDLDVFDHQLFTLVGNKALLPAEPILSDKGECLCEDCLLIKYSFLLETGVIKSRNSMKVSCKQCKVQIKLDEFQKHIHDVEEVKPNLLKIMSYKSDEIKTGTVQNTTSRKYIENKCCPNGDFLIEAGSKLPNKLPVFKNDILNHNHDNDIDDEDDDDDDGDNDEDEDDDNVDEDDNNVDEDDDDNGDDDDDDDNKDEITDIEESKMSRKTFYNFLKYRNALSKTDKDHKNDTKNPEKNSHKNSQTSSFKEDSKVLDLLKNTKSANTSKNNGLTFPCGHSCKLEEELKSEFKKAYQETCDHHKESKKCDCTFCEVFGTSSNAHKANETRNRLRIRLNKRNEKMGKLIPNKPNSKTSSNPVKNVTNKAENFVGGLPSKAGQSTRDTPLKSSNENTSKNLINDIHGLLNFIEGNTKPDTVALAEKKAAKKARQREKKEQERLKIEEEERKKAKEEQRKIEEKLRIEELERQLAEKAKIKELKKEAKKKKQKAKSKEAKRQELMEETIPAMVTIKRVVENQNALPTVTITLKGSTPDQDKLLYTLVNGHDDTQSGDNKKINKKNHNQGESLKNGEVATKTKKNNGNNKNGNNNNGTNKTNYQSSVITKELRVTLAVDPLSNSTVESLKKGNDKQAASGNNTVKVNKKQEIKKEKKSKNTDLDIPMLRLPPGITITKVDGPMADRNYKTSSVDTPQYNSNIPVSKSGVIVVDTEKLIKQSSASSSTSSTTTTTTATITTGKKSRKKRNKKQDLNSHSALINNKPSMVTLKNPIFQNMQNQQNGPIKPENGLMSDLNGSHCQQAAIFKNENGMVTIRSSRLQQSLTNGSPMPKLLSDLKPVLGPEVPAPYMSSCSFPESSKISPFNAQEILSGLPGIEITKVDKRSAKNDIDIKRSCHTAEVSIIPASNGDKFNFDKDDLHYDSVFSPKDVLEDDMDAEERELEAFKRFCQQSVPPKRKEKVAHLNVKDIVLKKKNEKVSG